MVLYYFISGRMYGQFLTQYFLREHGGMTRMVQFWFTVWYVQMYFMIIKKKDNELLGLRSN